MAKKKSPAAKSSPAKSRTSGRKPSKKSPPKQLDHGHDHEQEEEIELDADECKAVDMVVDSEKVRTALEIAVNTAVTNAVRKICKEHGASLTLEQAQNVAMVLFGD